MTEVLVGHEEKLCSNVKEMADNDEQEEEEGETLLSNPAQRNPPRFESFIMTGDKMITLDYKVSPRLWETYEGSKQSSVPMNGIRHEHQDIFAGLSTAIKRQASKKGRLEPELKVPVSQSDNGIDRQVPYMSLIVVFSVI
uniref:RED_N domain-containing protein n=1 Tax=Syphacia muris TaxID=451379 RepID=A0A0N5AAV6_9BILA